MVNRELVVGDNTGKGFNNRIELSVEYLNTRFGGYTTFVQVCPLNLAKDGYNVYATDYPVNVEAGVNITLVSGSFDNLQKLVAKVNAILR